MQNDAEQRKNDVKRCETTQKRRKMTRNDAKRRDTPQKKYAGWIHLCPKGPRSAISQNRHIRGLLSP